MRTDPLVLCLTNTVAANFTANCLLAVGAKPAMVAEPSEAAELAALADAVLVNLGTVTERQAEAMRAAVRVAVDKGTPWVLDPVGVQMLSYRCALAHELIAHRPSVIRGNRAEIDFLGETGVTTLATDATDRIIQPNGSDDILIAGGDRLLQSVTATGCAQGGLCAAFLGRGETPVEACRSASTLMKRAGEKAREKSNAPGGFRIALVDALWELSHD